jgi:hypothetical protein
MIDVIFRTNLDLDHERWPTKLPAVPAVGDRIQSATDRDGSRLTLEVYSITWKYEEDSGFEREKWIPEIELHIVKDRFDSIAKFYEWYAPKCNKSLAYFI